MNERTLRLRPANCCSEVIEPAPLADDDQTRLIATFKALGDPTRMQIFRLIAAQSQPICACDIVDRFAVSQPTIAHHTRVLREAGLITSTKIGVWAYYQVDPAGVSLLGAIADLLLDPPEVAAAVA